MKDPFYQFIPQNTLDTLDNYVKHGLPPGGFVNACLANDFLGVVGRADHENSAVLREIAIYIANEIPAIAHGSQEIVNSWMEMGGTEAINKKQKTYLKIVK